MTAISIRKRIEQVIRQCGFNLVTIDNDKLSHYYELRHKGQLKMSVIRISNHCTSPSNWKDRYGSNNPTLSLSRKEIRRYRGNYNGILTKYFKKSFYSFVIYDPKTDGSQQCGNVQEEGIFIKQNSYDANQMTDELLVALENKIKAIASNAIVENKAYEFDNKTNKRYITSQRNRLAERDLHGFIRECVNKNLKR